MLYGRIFPLMLKGAVYKSYVRPAVLYGSEAWCLRESEMGILQRTKRSMVRAMCGVQLLDRKRSTNLMLMLGLNHNRSAGCVKQCSLVWLCIDERKWSCPKKGIRF